MLFIQIPVVAYVSGGKAVGFLCKWSRASLFKNQNSPMGRKGQEQSNESKVSILAYSRFVLKYSK
jgi:hypothetical protein